MSMKLHIGCGPHKLKGWIHVDVERYNHVDHLTEAHSLTLCNDGEVEAIYCSHTLEYYDWHDAVYLVLPEWHRVLKSGGRLWLAVPDWHWCKTEEIPLANIIGPLFGKRDGRYHKSVWSRETLSFALSACGFRGINTWSMRTIYDEASINVNDASNAPCSLNLYAEKV